MLDELMMQLMQSVEVFNEQLKQEITEEVRMGLLHTVLGIHHLWRY